jgi:hypothetical protein
MNRSEIQSSIQSFGLLKTLQNIAYRALNRVVFVRILKGVRISVVDATFMKCSQNYRGSFLDADALLRFASDPRNELQETFLLDALRNRDECYGFLAGDVLASYGWYSKRPTSIEQPELTLHFDPHYVYMYKGFTRMEHRGQRLHAVGMTRALDAYLAQGYKGIVLTSNGAISRRCDRVIEWGT